MRRSRGRPPYAWPDTRFHHRPADCAVLHSISRHCADANAAVSPFMISPVVTPVEDTAVPAGAAPSQHYVIPLPDAARLLAADV